MKKLYLILTNIIILHFLSGCVTVGSIKDIKGDGHAAENKALTSMASMYEFPSDKRLIYRMAWNGIPVGRITAESGGRKEYLGREVYVVMVTAESNMFLSKIYRVEDKYISYIDVKTLTSRRYEADREEGRYRKHVIVEYDFDKMEAIYTNRTDGSVKRCPIEKNVQDPVSAMCLFMTKSLHTGDKMYMTVNLNEKNYKLYGQVEELKIIRLPREGSFPAFKVRPYAELAGKPVKKGSGWMYFSAENNRYPLYGVVLIPFGRVTATLMKIEDLRQGVHGEKK